jgi:hypothetical protein
MPAGLGVKTDKTLKMVSGGADAGGGDDHGNLVDSGLWGVPRETTAIG